MVRPGMASCTSSISEREDESGQDGSAKGPAERAEKSGGQGEEGNIAYDIDSCEPLRRPRGKLDTVRPVGWTEGHAEDDCQRGGERREPQKPPHSPCSTGLA